MKIFLAPAILILTCCSAKNNNQFELGQSIPDSVFKYRELKLIKNKEVSKNYDQSNRRYSLNSLNDAQMKMLTDPFFGKDRYYNAYFYSKQTPVGSALPILLYLDRDDNSGVVLLCLSKSGKVVDHIDLTDEYGDYYEDDGKPVATSAERYSEFLNDSTIRITDLATLIDGYDKEGEVTRTDSVTMEYRISGNGKLKLLSKDSVRYSKVTK